MSNKEKSSKHTIFEVNGKPFIAIGGEAHNSSSSSADYMVEVWEKAKELGLNTLFLPASWELIEPVEGQFKFQLIDDIIWQAREYDCHIIFLWFGSWKNAQCMYAPEWVKKNLARFPRAQVVAGKNKIKLAQFYGMEYTTLSYLGEESRKADARSFAKFMEHLKEVDENEHTVIAVQVENETGLMGSDREHSKEADLLFESEVPMDFVSYMKSLTLSMDAQIRIAVEEGADQGSWEQVFGNRAGEIFSAYHIAGYVETVAAAGKAVYDLPMTVNCWLDKGEDAGKYPTGGPVAKNMEIWKFRAPSIDVYCPDIYVAEFCETCDSYTKLDNPLLIPETATHSHAAPRLVYTIGHYHAACFAPFGFEDMGKPFGNAEAFLFGMDVTDPLLQTPQNVEEYHWCADTLNNMMGLLTDKYGTDDLQAVISERMDMTPFDMSKLMAGTIDNSNVEHDTMMFGEIGFKIIMNIPLVARQDGVCLIVKESEDTFYILANGCLINPFSMNLEKPEYDIIALEEGSFVNGEWKVGRRLNGDEAASLCYNEYTLLKLKLFLYQ